jgi:hypothetical protein
VRCVLGCCEVVVVMMVVVVAVLVLVVVVLLERRMLPLSLWMLMHITSTKNKNPCLSSVPRPVALSSGIVASCFCASMSLHVRVHACARFFHVCDSFYTPHISEHSNNEAPRVGGTQGVLALVIRIATSIVLLALVLLMLLLGLVLAHELGQLDTHLWAPQVGLGDPGGTSTSIGIAISTETDTTIISIIASTTSATTRTRIGTSTSTKTA